MKSLELLKRPVSYTDLLEPYEQRHPSGCGPASLVMVYRALGVHVTEDKIIHDMKMTNEGASWRMMIENARSYSLGVSFHVNSLYSELQTIQRSGGLSIVGWWSNRGEGEPGSHFSPVKKVEIYTLTILDPTDGKKVEIPRQEFLERWFDEEGKRSFMHVRM